MKLLEDESRRRGISHPPSRPGASGFPRLGAALLAAALVAGCAELLVEAPGAGEASLQVALAFPGDVSAAAQQALGEAFDQADRVRVRLSGEGSPVVDETRAFGSAGQDARIRLQVPLGGDEEAFLLELELLLGSQTLFEAGTTVTLRRNSPTEVSLTVAPVASGVEVQEGVTLEALGEETQLEGAVVLATGHAIPGLSLTWSTAQTNVVAVQPGGRTTALAEGTAQAVGSFGGASGIVPIEVRQRVETVDVAPPTASLGVGGTRQLEALPEDPRGNPISGRAVQWSSSDPSVASVDAEGLVSGVSPGPATISAVIEGVEGTAQVVVTEDDTGSGDPPEISDAQLEILVVNGCPNGGTSHRISFTYAHPGGGITGPDARIRVRATLQPSGGVSTVDFPLDHPNVDQEGSGFEGRLAFVACAVFGSGGTHFVIEVRLQDAAGNVSDELIVVFERPSGANLRVEPAEAGLSAPD